ncbi:leucine-rich_repeat domain-containing protein [Hexamita inflata]|uniref:Leucine-rich repeat domain-containing protein n=1 Tax=Hexamita inflata TaxID=28002 RepID=A0AA86UP53_9EUKA|nr:leucine-rich repeat domain-containing protein [Hexamita inflata]
MQQQLDQITTFGQIYRQKQIDVAKQQNRQFTQSQFVKKQLPLIYQNEKIVNKYRDRKVNGELTIINEGEIDQFQFLQYFTTVTKLKLYGFQNIQIEDTLPNNIRELEIDGGDVTIKKILFLHKFCYKGQGSVQINQNFLSMSGAKICLQFNDMIKSLTLSFVKITDLYNIKGCNQLEYFNLSHNEISDINILTNFCKLTHLDVSFNKLQNFNAIKNNSELQHLNISNNLISSISVLKTFTKLVHFDASSNKIQEVKALENSDLEYLDVSNNPVKYICLNKYVKLQHVNLLNTEIYEFPEVIQQDLQSFQIQLQKQSSNILLLPQNIARIQQIQSRLQSLTINGYNLQLNQLQNKMNLFGLKSIDLSNSQLSDISGLHNFVELETINISTNSVVDISVIQCFPNLNKFVGCFNRIKDISVINACQKLEYLDLSHNCIVDIPQISLTLRHLNLNSNQVYNQTQLHNNLSFVSLLDNYICYYSNVLEYNQVAIQNVPDQQYIEHNQISQNLQQLLFTYESNNMQYFQHYQQYVITKQLNFNKYVHYSENITQFDSKFKSATFKDLDYLYEFSNWNYYKQMNKINKLEIFADNYIQGVNLCESQNIDAIILERCMNVRFNRVNYNITALVVKSCNLQSIYGIEQMQQLKFLNLSDNRLTDISSLQGLHNLEYLNLEDNQVADISPISELNNLVVLILKYKKVNPTDERASLNFEQMPTNLNVLVVKWYYLKSLQGIQKLDKLQYLKLTCNQLRDIKQLQYLVSLKTLDLSNNELVFVEPLLNLRKIQYLYLSNNLIPLNQLKLIQQFPDSQSTYTNQQLNYLQNIKCVTQSYQNLIKSKIRRTLKKQIFMDYKSKVQQAMLDCYNQEKRKYLLINNLLNSIQDSSQ